MGQRKCAWDQLIEEGSIRTSHRVLLKIGGAWFGEPDAETEAALTAINDLKRLDRMLDCMTEVKPPVKSWKALLAIK